jgi:hypothetical protein
MSVEQKYLGQYLSQKTSLSRFSVHSGTKLLRLKLYSFTVVQKLHDAESVEKVRFCKAVYSGKVVTFPAHFTDEAKFPFNGHADIINNKSWMVDTYKIIHEVP